ncbi:hypothetical protein [Methylomagnum ishizawai]|uniref:hypothetical protein n=1 Tax=Methylomagnum ishizawai TaxID=1760988 RepID=UPI001C3262A7|nr:hypothetical protein [Methylomagnum ishizawai]BBL76518.1 hypothetical protein MishRS11D_36160 [Methylomagnum ishizawai]
MATTQDVNRQKRLAKKKIKREEKNQRVIYLDKAQSEKLIKESLEAVGKFPIHQCLIPQGLFANGFGTAIIARQINDEEVIAAGFMLDVYCMGVRNAFLRALEVSEYTRTIGRMHEHENFGLAEPALIRALVEQCAEYADQLGFKPHDEYEEARHIFGAIDPKECTETFNFGKDGKPHFVAGPNDAPKRCQRIIERLTEKCGADGFTYKLRKDA